MKPMKCGDLAEQVDYRSGNNEHEPIEAKTCHSDITIRKDEQLKLDNMIFQVKSVDPYANSSHIGYMGYGLTFFLYGLSLAGVYPMNSAVIAMALCYGGIAQITGGIFEMIKGRTFSAVTFIVFGFFWISIVLLSAMPVFGWAEALDDNSHACYFFIWMLLALSIFVGSLKQDIVSICVFFCLSLMFLLLCAGKWGKSPNTIIAGGVFATISGIFAVYHGSAETINEIYKKTYLPIFPIAEVWGNGK